METPQEVVWPSVIYNDQEKRLVYCDHNCKELPDAIINIYADKTHCLDLSFNRITSLEGLRMFPNLEELILDNNLLTDAFSMPVMDKLHTLSLNNNKISNLELTITKIAHNLPALRYLSVLGNVACPNQLSDKTKDEEDYERYRYFVIHYLPNLNFLDSRRVTTGEREEAKRRGQFMKVVRPKGIEDNLTVMDNSVSKSLYTPLPNSKRELGDHQGAYGKCSYKYTGANSEGNRFIMNNDL